MQDIGQTPNFMALLSKGCCMARYSMPFWLSFGFRLVCVFQDKWAIINEAYQKLPFSLDTPTKKRRKEELEKQLGQIEKDIKLLLKGDRLLVVED